MMMNIDVVCGMKVDEDGTKWTSDYLNRTYYFCSEDCKYKFDQKPEQYIVKTGIGTSTATDVNENN